MSSCCFIVEIVIQNIELTKSQIENACDIKISVHNNNFSFIIYSNQDSLTEFRAGQSYEFYAFPELLRLEMQIFPITFTVYYKDIEIGSTEFKWPEKITDSVDEDMKEMIQKDVVNLIHCKEKVGCMDLILRLRVQNKFGTKEKTDLQCVTSKSMVYYAQDDDLVCGLEPSSVSSNKTFNTPSVFSGCHKFANENDQHVDKKKQTLPPPKNSSQLSDSSLSLPRCCPICKTDITWIPKSVPCPKCNYLIEDVKSMKYNDKLTSEQILKMYAMTCKESSSDEEIRISEDENKRENSDKQIIESMPNTIVKQTEIEVSKPLKKVRKHVKRIKRIRVNIRSRNFCDSNQNFQVEDPLVTAYIKSLLPQKPKRHEMCARLPSRVPAHMGWMWTAFATGSNEKWRPGAIRRPIKEIMSWFLKDFPVDTIPISRYAYCRFKQKSKQSFCIQSEKQKPLLHIKKQKGEYTVTMCPLKKTEELLESVDPFANMKPITFRIIKNPTSLFVHGLKSKLKDLGYSPCICHKPIAECVCQSFKEKIEINDIVESECIKSDVPRGNDTFVMSDVTESDSEIDFAIAPPISQFKPHNLKKSDYTHVGTQYSMDDWCLKPKISIFGPPYFCKNPKMDVNKCKIFVNQCPQNIQPPLIIPKIEKPVKGPTKKGRKGKKKSNSRSRKK